MNIGMFFRLKNQTARALHDARCRGVLASPPVTVREGAVPLIFVTQLTRRDLLIYLVAIKSMLSRFGHGRVVQIDDNSLTNADRELLQHHLPGSRCIPINEVDTGQCPRGGTWERLCAILDFSLEAFVIQVDADTLACGLLPEVSSCIAENRSFTLGTRQGRRLLTVVEAAAFAASQPGGHIQLVAERALLQLPYAATAHYVRGSSGFAGFARGAFSRQRLQEFSLCMQRITGSRWREWGTEQVSSNFAIANSDGARVLPYPKYACFDLDMDPEQAVFLHFIGTNRFDRGVYAKKSRAFIREMERR